MRLGDHEHNDGHETKWAAIGPAALIGCLLLVASMSLVMAMDLDALRPKVGDIVVFQPTTRQQDVWAIDVGTYRPTKQGQNTCRIDPAVIARQGGSLMIEARNDSTPDSQYRLHWAGAHSAEGTGDCPGAADLTVSRVDLQKLANAAGGFGVEAGNVR